MAKYTFCAGSHLKVPAEVAAPVLEGLANENRLTAANLVDVSRPEDAPLHPEFEWRDDVAAERWREEQARQIIRCIRVVSEEDPDQAPVRMYVHPVLESPNYEPLHLVLQDQDKRSSLLKAALRDMVSFKAKYKELQELAKVMDAVDQTLPMLEAMQ